MPDGAARGGAGRAKRPGGGARVGAERTARAKREWRGRCRPNDDAARRAGQDRGEATGANEVGLRRCEDGARQTAARRGSAHGSVSLRRGRRGVAGDAVGPPSDGLGFGARERRPQGRGCPWCGWGAGIAGPEERGRTVGAREMGRRNAPVSRVVRTVWRRGRGCRRRATADDGSAAMRRAVRQACHRVVGGDAIALWRRPWLPCPWTTFKRRPADHGADRGVRTKAPGSRRHVRSGADGGSVRQAWRGIVGSSSGMHPGRRATAVGRPSGCSAAVTVRP
jgi:hypothetical protein